MNKRGNVFAIILIMTLLLVAGVTIVIGKYFTDQFYTKLNEQVDETPEMVAAEAKMKTAWGNFDYAMVVLTIILMIGLVMTSFLIPSHPIFIVINVLGIFGLVFLGMVMTNVYGEIMGSGDAELTTTAEQYPKITYLMQYLPFIAAILVFVVSIVVYTRANRGGTY